VAVVADDAIFPLSCVMLDDTAATTAGESVDAGGGLAGSLQGEVDAVTVGNPSRVPE
jgi:hypothetical protein